MAEHLNPDSSVSSGGQSSSGSRKRVRRDSTSSVPSGDVEGSIPSRRRRPNTTSFFPSFGTQEKVPSLDSFLHLNSSTLQKGSSLLSLSSQGSELGVESSSIFLNSDAPRDIVRGLCPSFGEVEFVSGEDQPVYWCQEDRVARKFSPIPQLVQHFRALDRLVDAWAPQATRLQRYSHIRFSVTSTNSLRSSHLRIPPLPYNFHELPYIQRLPKQAYYEPALTPQLFSRESIYFPYIIHKPSDPQAPQLGQPVPSSLVEFVKEIDESLYFPYLRLYDHFHLDRLLLTVGVPLPTLRNNRDFQLIEPLPPHVSSAQDMITINYILCRALERRGWVTMIYRFIADEIVSLAKLPPPVYGTDPEGVGTIFLHGETDGVMDLVVRHGCPVYTIQLDWVNSFDPWSSRLREVDLAAMKRLIETGGRTEAERRRIEEERMRLEDERRKRERESRGRGRGRGRRHGQPETSAAEEFPSLHERIPSESESICIFTQTPSTPQHPRPWVYRCDSPSDQSARRFLALIASEPEDTFISARWLSYLQQAEGWGYIPERPPVIDVDELPDPPIGVGRRGIKVEDQSSDQLLVVSPSRVVDAPSSTVDAPSSVIDVPSTDIELAVDALLASIPLASSSPTSSLMGGTAAARQVASRSAVTLSSEDNLRASEIISAAVLGGMGAILILQEQIARGTTLGAYLQSKWGSGPTYESFPSDMKEADDYRFLVDQEVWECHGPYPVPGLSSGFPMYRLAIGKATQSGRLRSQHVERTAMYWLACAWLGSPIARSFVEDASALQGLYDPQYQMFSELLRRHWVPMNELGSPERKERQRWAQRYIDVLTSHYKCQVVHDLNLEWRTSFWSPPKSLDLPFCPPAPPRSPSPPPHPSILPPPLPLQDAPAQSSVHRPVDITDDVQMDIDDGPVNRQQESVILPGTTLMDEMPSTPIPVAPADPAQDSMDQDHNIPFMSPYDAVAGHLPFLPRGQWFMLSIFVSPAPSNPDLSTSPSRIAFVGSHLHRGVFGLKVTKVHHKRLKGSWEWSLLFKERERLIQFRADCLAQYQCHEEHNNEPYHLRGSLCDYDSPFDTVYLSLVLESHHPRRDWLWTHMPSPLFHSFGSTLGAAEAQPSHTRCRRHTIDLERVDESLLEQLGDDLAKTKVWFILRAVYFYHLDRIRLPGAFRFKSYLLPTTAARDVCLSLVPRARDSSDSNGPESISLVGPSSNRVWAVVL